MKSFENAQYSRIVLIIYGLSALTGLECTNNDGAEIFFHAATLKEGKMLYIIQAFAHLHDGLPMGVFGAVVWFYGYFQRD